MNRKEKHNNKQSVSDNCRVKKCGACIIKLASFKIWLAELFAPVALLAARLVMADVFFTSGWLKFKDWSTTLTLFEYEHPVPFLPKSLADMLGLVSNHLPATIAAPMGVSVELAGSVLLALGLGGRLAAFLMLVMVAVIQFSYQSSTEHLYWALLFCIILTQGPGKLSIDHLIRKRFYCPPQCCNKAKCGE